MKTIINIILSVVLLVVITLSATNIVVQLQTVREAKKKNLSIKSQIFNLEEENLRLESKISFATTSARLREQAVDKLGLGLENDYWLLLPKDSSNFDITPKIEVAESTPSWKQWYLLLSR